MLLKEVRRRTGLTRRQLRYLEERELIGPILRSDERRIFSDRQVSWLEIFARLRDLGAGLDEAAALAAESLGAEPAISEERLAALAERALSDTQRRARTAADLTELFRRRRGSAA